MFATTQKVLSPISKEKARQQMNAFGRKREAFFFLFDFELKKPIIIGQQALKEQVLWFDINGTRNYTQPIVTTPKKVQLEKWAMTKKKYQKAFELVQAEINSGNSYLLNLTFPTAIQVNLGLKEIFLNSRAKYKLWLPNQLVVFSPESFVRIYNGKIAAFPMKGTIDASVPNAEAVILADKKEMAEHCTIVDLLRNDLNLVASQVQVERFRYIEYLKSAQKNLLQVSSKITGVLPNNYQATIGDILLKLLPAGSISGAPKKKTIDIIRAAEGQDRGYYTGVFGYFDGTNLNSGVLIRYIEKVDNRLFYRSGGGITASSDCTKEYQELLDKIYVPIY